MFLYLLIANIISNSTDFYFSYSLYLCAIITVVVQFTFKATYGTSAILHYLWHQTGKNIVKVIIHLKNKKDNINANQLLNEKRKENISFFFNIGNFDRFNSIALLVGLK